MKSLIPLSLYIHFPWCVKKCPYCDFNSHQKMDELPEKKYQEVLLRDLETDLNENHSRIQGRKIHSIFMGGGTPSLFSPEVIHALLSSIRELIDFESLSIEVTLEANPGTVDQSKFLGFRQAGVNRLSLGIQSFQPVQLQKLGRIHDDKAAFSAIEYAMKAGFDNFNCDLMHGLPLQTIETALQDIKTALSFSPPHLSYYQLTLEPNTLFYQKPPVLPPEKILGEIERESLLLLRENHYERYEISAYCSKESFQCQHNLNYWEFGDYLGIGAGAHGKLSDIVTGEIIRLAKTKHPKSYLTHQNLITSWERVPKDKVIFEFMLNALRLQKPIPWQLFVERTFMSQESVKPLFEKLFAKNLIEFDHQHFAPTLLGRQYLNQLLTEFL